MPCRPLPLGQAPGDTMSAPKSRMAMCVGNYAVPTTNMALVEQDGTWTNVNMVDLSTVSGALPLFKWLWEPLGISRAEWRAGAPWKLPLMREIQAWVSAPRAKRGRDGKFRDAEGNLTPRILGVSARGRRLLVLNDVRKALVDLTESADTMGWSLAELWHDLHPAVIQDHGDQPADDTPALATTILPPLANLRTHLLLGMRQLLK